MSRIYAIPDIHGRYDLLDALTEKLFKTEKLDLEKDKLVFLGDMIDRGPDSKKVLEFVRAMVEQFPGRVHALAGNHEYLCINACTRARLEEHQLWMWSGGGPTLMSYGTKMMVPQDTVAWMASLPLSHEEDGFFFSHAPVPREEDRGHMKGQPFSQHELIWTYDPGEGRMARDFGDGKIGICGHVHALRRGIFEPRFYDHYIFADAGCGCHMDAPLVAIEVKSRKVITVSPADLPPPFRREQFYESP